MSHSQQRPDPRRQFQFIHRLRQKIIRSRLHRLLDVRHFVQRGHHDHRDVSRLFLLLQSLAHLVPAQLRHHDVQQDQIRLFVHDTLQRRHPVVSHVYLIPLTCQISLQQFAVLLIVIHNQNARGRCRRIIRHFEIQRGTGATRGEYPRNIRTRIIPPRPQFAESKPRFLGLLSSTSDSKTTPTRDSLRSTAATIVPPPSPEI